MSHETPPPRAKAPRKALSTNTGTSALAKSGAKVNPAGAVLILVLLISEQSRLTDLRRQNVTGTAQQCVYAKRATG